MVSKEQKEQIINNCKILCYDSISEYVRDSALTKNFLILDRLNKIMKFIEETKNGS
ncbi:hypothetical protein HY837_03245 [archaeon]|nr:hypothetical protein [archaeon]